MPEISNSSNPYASLPNPMLEYLKKIESFTGSKVAIISMGPDRADTILVPGVLRDISIDV